MPAPFRPRFTSALLGLGLLVPTVAPAHEAPGEYFFDTDPGPGSATPLPLADPPPALADIGALALPLPSPTPAVGVTLLGLRFRNANGDWGPTRLQQVSLLRSAGGPALSFAWGAAASTAASPAADGTLTLTRPSSTPGEANRLVLRAVSGALAGPALIQRVQPFGGSTPSRLYYAFDQNPDPATSNAFVELTDVHRLDPATVSLPLLPSTPGYHLLHLQLHDATGARTEHLRHLHITPSRVEALAGLAYTFRPVGSDAPATVERVPLLASAEAQDITLPFPASLPNGACTLVLQLAHSNTDLGFATTGELILGSAYDAWAATALAGREASDRGPLADPDQDQLVNLLEYAFGLDPLQPATSAPYSIQTQTTPSATPYFLVEYRQREGGAGELGVDYTADGLRYTVEGSTDLQIWIPFSQLPAIASHRSRQPNGDGTEAIRLEIFHGQTLDYAKRVFLRLKISVVP